MTIRLRFICVILICLFNAPAMAAQHYFAISFHVIEGLHQSDGDNPSNGLVADAIAETTKLLGYDSTRAVQSRTWLVRSDGDMDRILDYRGSTLRFVDEVEVQFGLKFDAQNSFLTIAELQFSTEQQVLLRTSLGVEDHGAAVAGIMEIEEKQFFVVIEFKAASEPFEHQSSSAAFTIIDDWSPP